MSAGELTMAVLAADAKRTAKVALRKQAGVSYREALNQLECVDLALEGEDPLAAAAHVDRARDQLSRMSQALRSLADNKGGGE